MKPFWGIRLFGLLMLCGLFGACFGAAGNREISLADSLNKVAYALRYRDLDACRRVAYEAYDRAEDYTSGRAEACNHLGFVAFMGMNFSEAERLYDKVYTLTRNELELLVSDVGMMKICQRKAMNKEFYDYRNRALQRMKRIAEEAGLFIDLHEHLRLQYAISEFYMASAVYYYYLQQQEDAWKCISQADVRLEQKTDTGQLLHYHYIKGTAGLYKTATADEKKLKMFDELYAVWRIASLKGYVYFEASGLQGLADLMVLPADYKFLKKYRSHALLQLELPLDSLFPLHLSQRALQGFKRYQDPYQMAGTYVTIGKYLNMHGRYAEALDTLTLALEKVNRIHGTAPECISRICEQLSVSYAGLGQKEESDIHRNMYLDILDDTRQDKELESRYQALEQEAMKLNGLLAGVVAGFLAIGVCFWLFNRWSKMRSRKHVERLQQILEVCQLITSAIPADAQSEKEVLVAIEQAVGLPLQKLLGHQKFAIVEGQLLFDGKLSKEEQTVVSVLNPYIQWAIENGLASISLNDERKRLEKQRYVYEQHVASHKRRNIEKKACLAVIDGIQAYIDRILHEIQKLTTLNNGLDEDVKKGKYQYIDELVSTINEYNEILALWIKMKQGTFSMNIETFELDELFDLLRKGGRSFELRHQSLQVIPANVAVKADKSLTMFMLNTLADNARKYTPQGGKVVVYAFVGKDYVEISVKDTGCGLSESDVSLLNGDKVYDPRKIGLDAAEHGEKWMQKKGNGFGLMNCKGIIDKYRKTNELFHVCQFGVESEKGKGSRFFFRLPVGVRKVCMLCFLLVGNVVSTYAQELLTDVTPTEESYEALLDSASDYANEAYYANVDGDYVYALQCIDSAMWCLNKHYLRYASQSGRTMTLCGDADSPAEMDWWKEPFNSDFHVILDIRNEAAVAFLALKQWQAYDYNNKAYTALYKLLGEDQSLESYCRQLERSSGNKRVGMILSMVLLLIFLMGYYILYIRKRLQNRWNLEQVLNINRQVFAAALPVVTEQTERLRGEEYGVQRIPQYIVDASFEEINDLLGIEDLGMAICHAPDEKLEFAFHQVVPEVKSAEWLLVQTLMQRCFVDKCYLEEGNRQMLPLQIEVGGASRCIGVMYVKRTEGMEQETDRLLLELIASYVAAVAYNAVVKLASKYQDIEAAEDEANRVSWEDNVLHVQNQVLDNCLSTIKHETVYYPNKIKLLINKLRLEGITSDEEQETLVAIEELITYYKGIFTILSRCASRQLEEVTFRRTTLEVADWMSGAEKYFKKVVKECRASVSLHVSPLEAQIVGDKNLLDFLLECLIDESLSVEQDGDLYLSACLEEGSVRLQFTDRRRNYTQETLNGLFYPSLQRMYVDSKGRMHGAEFLICKQIIRDHDEYIGRRGCKMNAEVRAEGGFTIYFTLTVR